VTTKKFLEAFGFASLRDLAQGRGPAATRAGGEDDLDSALGLDGEEDSTLDTAADA
jgi:hypothetical protein